jgi:DnaK suppressor protein
MTMTMGTIDARALLRGLYLELSAEYDEASADVATIAGTADRAGDDDVDAGSKVAQREHHLSLLASIRERRDQVEYALRRLDDGTYGQCDQCGQPIDPARLEVFPAATSCVRCKRR